MDPPGEVANPARRQLNRENVYFPVPVRAYDKKLVSRDGLPYYILLLLIILIVQLFVSYTSNSLLLLFIILLILTLHYFLHFSTSIALQ